MSLPHTSLANPISKVCLANASTKKLQEIKLKLYKNLKKNEVVEELHEININVTCNSKTKVLQSLLDM